MDKEGGSDVAVERKPMFCGECGETLEMDDDTKLRIRNSIYDILHEQLGAEFVFGGFGALVDRVYRGVVVAVEGPTVIAEEVGDASGT